jgi:protein-S-isoprenylcysteine O-methyltransferase Ste14
MATPLDTKIPPPVLAAVLGVATAVAGQAWPRWPAAAPPRIVAGALVAAAGLALGAAAFGAFGRQRTTIDPVHPERASALVTDGVYRLTRNPMYVALAAALTGIAVALGGGARLLAPALFVAWVTLFQILPEERALAARFGQAYDDYRRRARRWL